MQVSSTRDQSAGLTLGVPATIAAALQASAETPFALSGRLTAFDGVSIREPPLECARVFPPELMFFRVINFQNRTWKSRNPIL
jgi:hypothetical protein